LASITSIVLPRLALAQSVVLRGATVIDGTDRAPIPNATVVIKNGWISAIGPSAEVRAPAGARVIPMAGKFLLPGFTEMHGHLAIAVWEVDTTGGKRVLRYPYDDEASKELTRSQLAFGITTVRNPAGPTKESVALRNRVRTGELVGPRIITAGAPLDRPSPNTMMDPVTTEAEVRAAVAKQAAAGVDFIKLYSTLDSAQMAWGIDEAHKHGLPALAHLWKTSWTDAVNAGLDGITHIIVSNPKLLPEARRAEYLAGIKGGQFMFDWFKHADFDGPEIQEMIATVVRRRISLDPTLLAFEFTAWSDDTTRYSKEALEYMPPSLFAKAQQSNALRPMWPAEDYANAKIQYRKMEELTRRLHQAGVPLTVGTDGANPWLYHYEMELLVGAGIPPADVVRMATRNAALALGLISEIGTVEVGKRADLVVLDADPTVDIRNTRRIAWVVQGGRVAKPETYLPARLRK
jgi:imidazolonepropionase-like amidohydrolase